MVDNARLQAEHASAGIPWHWGDTGYPPTPLWMREVLPVIEQALTWPPDEGRILPRAAGPLHDLLFESRLLNGDLAEAATVVAGDLAVADPAYPQGLYGHSVTVLAMLRTLPLLYRRMAVDLALANVAEGIATTAPAGPPP